MFFLDTLRVRVLVVSVCRREEEEEEEEKLCNGVREEGKAESRRRALVRKRTVDE